MKKKRKWNMLQLFDPLILKKGNADQIWAVTVSKFSFLFTFRLFIFGLSFFFFYWRLLAIRSTICRSALKCLTGQLIAAIKEKESPKNRKKSLKENVEHLIFLLNFHFYYLILTFPHILLILINHQINN